MEQFWTEIAVETTAEAAEAVGEVMEGAGCHGVVYDDPVLAEDFSKFGDLVDERLQADFAGKQGVKVTGYLPVDDRLDHGVQMIHEGVKRVAEFLPLGSGEISLRRVAEEDWADAWKAYFKPEVIGGVVIRPSWEEYQAEPGQVVVDLDPGMAFGTGTHPSTRLCVELLQETLRPGQQVLDVGTGSGILAIAAAKLAEAQVTAVDIDPVAVKVCKENAALNKVEDRIRALQGDLFSAVPGETFDLVLANIIAAVIIELLPQIPPRLRPGGRLIAAGIIDSRAVEVEAEAAANGLRILKKAVSGEWVAYLMGR